MNIRKLITTSKLHFVEIAFTLQLIIIGYFFAATDVTLLFIIAFLLIELIWIIKEAGAKESS